MVALRAEKTDIILAGVDEYLDAVTVLPPALWDPKIRIEPPNQTPTQESRKLQSNYSIASDLHKEVDSVSEVNKEEEDRKKNGLVRSGRYWQRLTIPYNFFVIFQTFWWFGWRHPKKSAVLLLWFYGCSFSSIYRFYHILILRMPFANHHIRWSSRRRDRK